MSTRPGISIRTALALIGSLALAATLLAASPASAASPTACRVRNLETGITKASLQKAVFRARPGDRLTVKGTCKGTTTIRKDLTIRGIHRPVSGRPTLDGARIGRVVTVKYGVKVIMKNLTILHGTTPGDGRWGAGLYNWGTLVLRDVIVRDNHTTLGGGGGENAGTLVLYGSSSIRANTANSGGGLVNLESSTLVLKDSSSIRGNHATFHSGGVLNWGRLVLNGSSSIRGNTATSWGGGVSNAGSLTMQDSSSITGNHAGQDGGGIRNVAGILDGVVCDGTSANVHQNTPDDCYPPAEP